MGIQYSKKCASFGECSTTLPSQHSTITSTKPKLTTISPVLNDGHVSPSLHKLKSKNYIRAEEQTTNPWDEACTTRQEDASEPTANNAPNSVSVRPTTTPKKQKCKRRPHKEPISYPWDRAYAIGQEGAAQSINNDAENLASVRSTITPKKENSKKRSQKESNSYPWDRAYDLCQESTSKTTIKNTENSVSVKPASITKNGESKMELHKKPFICTWDRAYAICVQTAKRDEPQKRITSKTRKIRRRVSLRRHPYSKTLPTLGEEN